MKTAPGVGNVEVRDIAEPSTPPGHVKIAVQAAEIAMLPKSTVRVDGKDAKQLLALIEALEEMDDVAKVSSNFDIDAEALTAATA